MAQINDISSILRQYREASDDPIRIIDHIWLVEKFAKYLKEENDDFITSDFYSLCGIGLYDIKKYK